MFDIITVVKEWTEDSPPVVMRDGKLVLRNTAVGMCPRALSYHLLGYKPADFPPYTQRLFESGHMFERWWLSKVDSIIRPTRAAKEWKLELVDFPVIVTAQADALSIAPNAYLLEFKRMGNVSFGRYLKEGLEKAFPQYLLQMWGEMEIYNRSACVLVAVNADSSPAMPTKWEIPIADDRSTDFDTTYQVAVEVVRPNPDGFMKRLNHTAMLADMTLREKRPQLKPIDLPEFWCSPAYCPMSGLCKEKEVVSQAPQVINKEVSSRLSQLAKSYHECQVREADAKRLKEGVGDVIKQLLAPEPGKKSRKFLDGEMSVVVSRRSYTGFTPQANVAAKQFVRERFGESGFTDSESLSVRVTAAEEDTEQDD